MKAKALREYISVLAAYPMGDDSVVEVSCPHHVAFTGLPAAVEFEGNKYGRAGWNSDHGIAYYKTSAPFGKRVTFG